MISDLLAAIAIGAATASITLALIALWTIRR